MWLFRNFLPQSTRRPQSTSIQTGRSQIYFRGTNRERRPRINMQTKLTQLSALWQPRGSRFQLKINVTSGHSRIKSAPGSTKDPRDAVVNLQVSAPHKAYHGAALNA